MKAIINGITVEGSPQEIMEYQRIVGAERSKELHDLLKKKITSGDITHKCPNEGSPCYCTGACTSN